MEVPGFSALNKGGHGELTALSCASPGNCSAGGFYTDSSRHALEFVVSEVNGTWHTAIEVPGLSSLNAGFGAAGVMSMSCASAGNCSAGGNYQGSRGQEPFVVSQVNGTWHTAIEVPGFTKGNGTALVPAMSCTSPGNCTGGGFASSLTSGGPFLVSEVNGTWHTAIKVPGMSAISPGGGGAVNSLSCGSAGNCAAGGSYLDSSGINQGFVASEVNGTWGDAIKVPGSAALGPQGLRVESVSCAPAGSCSADGYYLASGGGAFVVSEVKGTWGVAAEILGAPPYTTGPNDATAVSCTSSGNCAAGGVAAGPTGDDAFTVSQVNGSWGTGSQLAGVTLSNRGSSVASISCSSSGNCSAGGNYDDSSSDHQAWVASEVHGTWGDAIEVPGTATLNRGGAQVYAVSCASSGNCAAGGSYTDSSGHSQAFVVNRT